MTESDPTANPAPVVLGGRYEVHRRLARGGMAEVFLARDQALDRPVAVKILFPEYATDPAFVERFRREAQAAANLSHPNIVGVYDWGAESGTYYIVMEYVEGQSLAEVIRSNGPLQPRRAVEIAFEVAGALGAAHSRGVVHRDVKPGNVLLSTSGAAKVTDFGIARALSSPTDDLTQAGSVMGTATYFSPEQAQGFAVDERSDLYSLGVVLYEMLCGRPPFVGDSPVAIAYKHVQEWPPRPSQFVSGVPAGLESVILKLLAKKPEQRYRSAEDVRADLRRFLDGQITVAEQEFAGPAVAAAAGAAAGLAAGTTPNAGEATVVGQPPVVDLRDGSHEPVPQDQEWYPDEEPEDTGTKNKAFIASVVVLLLVLGGLITWVVWSSRSDVEEVAVPNVATRTEQEAVELLKAAGFNPVIQREASNDVLEDIVIRTDPAGETMAEKGSDVTLFVSSGPDGIEVPKIIGLPVAEAQAALTAAELKSNVTDVANDAAVGTVVAATPTEGELVQPGALIELQVSAGPAPVDIPDVSNRTVNEARRALSDAGFVVGTTTTEPSNDVAKDRVIRTDPAGQAAKNATINLVVSEGRAPVKVPDVVGSLEADARAEITALGLRVSSRTRQLPAGDANNGRVVEVSPSEGTDVGADSTVTITIGVASAAATTTTSSTPATTSTTVAGSP